MQLEDFGLTLKCIDYDKKRISKQHCKKSRNFT
jgi:hypothetical protein